MASGGGSIEGYLIKIDEDYGSIVYCILEEGKIQYYNGKGGILLGEFELTGNKINASLIRNDSSTLPNRFIVTSKRRLEAKKDLFNKNFSQELDQDQRILFAASTPETQEEWATAVLNWNKHCWEDASTIFSYKDESHVLRRLLQTYNIKEKPRKASQLGAGQVVPVL